MANRSNISSLIEAVNELRALKASVAEARERDDANNDAFFLVSMGVIVFR